VSRNNDLYLELETRHGWISVPQAVAAAEFAAGETARLPSTDAVTLLAAPAALHARLVAIADSLRPETLDRKIVMPFDPRSFRDFMLYEAHAVAAARGMVGRFMPAAAGVVRAYEALTRRTFPKLRPHALWYRQPIYYMGNHLTVASSNEAIEMPPYTRALDYELELGFVIGKPLFNNDAATCEAAIAGFVVLNDFSARDVQLAEMASGFGPQKAKHFASAISAEIVSADVILPRWQRLRGSIRINGELIAEPFSAGAKWSLGELLAHACSGERLYPGELFGTGTFPGGSGIETGHLLRRGDTVEIAIEGIGSVTNGIV
jgi:2-keto-4-pentenoate hydratase/2-oxohepta-3-ene-1,7-dioic acid hydratase in catechol pathway